MHPHRRPELPCVLFFTLLFVPNFIELHYLDYCSFGILCVHFSDIRIFCAFSCCFLKLYWNSRTDSFEKILLFCDFVEAFEKKCCHVDCYTLADCKLMVSRECTSVPVECAMGQSFLRVRCVCTVIMITQIMINDNLYSPYNGRKKRINRIT